MPGMPIAYFGSKGPKTGPDLEPGLYNNYARI